MKKNNLEPRILSARLDSEAGNAKFVKSTMEAIKARATNETFSKFLRKTNVTKKETFKMKYEKLKWKFKQLPSYAAALIILGSLGTVGAAAYGAYRWIYPKVSITNIQEANDENKREYTVDSQCGEFFSGKDLKYELAQDSGLTDKDVRKVFENTCAYNALSSFIESHWVSDNDRETVEKKNIGDLITIYDSSNLFAGSTDANPAFGLNIGRISSINKTTLAIELPVYRVENVASSDTRNPFKYYPEGKIIKRTVPLADKVEVWEDGKMQKLDDVKVGDMVQIVTRTQNKTQYYEDIQQKSLGEQVTFDTVGIIKTNIDTRYVAGGASQIGDPAIVDALAALGPCDKNEQYLCVYVPNQILGPVYSTLEPEIDRDNQKYLRQDIDIQDPSNAYGLDGRVLKIDGPKLTLETRGQKKTFTVELPYDAVAKYNQPKTIKTGRDASMSLKLEVGDLLQIVYIQQASENRLQIKPGDLQGLFVLQQIQPDGSLKKY